MLHPEAVAPRYACE